MKRSLQRLVATLACATTWLSLGAPARAADPAKDALVQAPALAAPERGALSGALAQLAFGAAELAQGVFSLAAPLAAPDSRGQLLASIFPHYTPGSGLSEWGQGWSVQLSIRRHRSLGDLDYQSDELE